jgi:hypothetical protein
MRWRGMGRRARLMDRANPGLDRGRVLAGLLFGQLLAHHLDPLDHELEAIPAPFGARYRLLNIEKGFGVVQFLAQLFEEGMDLGVDQKQLAAKAWLQE